MSQTYSLIDTSPKEALAARRIADHPGVAYGCVVTAVRVEDEGLGIPELLEEVVKKVPPPRGNPEGPPRAMIIDAWFDNYVGVVMLVRPPHINLIIRSRISGLHAGRVAHVVEQLLVAVGLAHIQPAVHQRARQVPLVREGPAGSEEGSRLEVGVSPFTGGGTGMGRELVRQLNAAGAGAIGFLYYSGHGAAESDTGMSGAGRSTAAKCLEDLGWFVIDNLPTGNKPQSIPSKLRNYWERLMLLYPMPIKAGVILAMTAAAFWLGTEVDSEKEIKNFALVQEQSGLTTAFDDGLSNPLSDMSVYEDENNHLSRDFFFRCKHGRLMTCQGADGLLHVCGRVLRSKTTNMQWHGRPVSAANDLEQLVKRFSLNIYL